MNHKRGQRLVIEHNGIAACRVSACDAPGCRRAGSHGVRAVADHDGPGFAVEDVTAHSPRFAHCQNRTGRQSGNRNPPVRVRDVFSRSHGISVRVRDGECDPGDGIGRAVLIFGDCETL